ncbi:MAG: sugar ABC transporter ATP-binding protein [Pirellulaceae bacterium]|nr:sugar ABC transporter ATP-binding protein [Pirellulaceae bacterium]
MTEASDHPLLQMRSISKSFGATRALRDVSFTARAGRVLALIGENGAGKSTLMKILSGAHQPDSGEMKLNQEPYQPTGPQAARRAGVAMIYQELNLAPDLSVADNIMLGCEIHRGGLLNRKQQYQRVRSALQTLGHENLNLNTPVRELSVGMQQLVEVARALVLNARVIVFDEPTSSLTQQDVRRLFEVIKRLKTAGHAIVYISHFLEEVREVGDDYTVLRDGQVAGNGQLAGVTELQLVSLMVGRSVDELFPAVEHQSGDVLLSLRKLAGEKLPRNISFDLCRGEILGIAGLVGAGRSELLRTLFALDPIRHGDVQIAGQQPKHSPAGRIRAGMGYVSEDRKTEGLAQVRSIADNISLSRLAPYTTVGWVNLSARRDAVHEWMKRLEIKAFSPEQEVQSLSGGNQQKVAIARVLHQDADILLLDEPTRGIDVGTKSQIYRLIGEQAATGKAVIFVSSYLPELLAVCDRIAVMSRGEIKEIRAAEDWTEESALAVAVS